MSIGSLIKHFAAFDRLPIYAEDVRDRIVAMGVQDEIHFVELDVPPGEIQGTFLRWRERRGIYSEHVNISTIFYNKHVPPDEQNFICCKELMHVFDHTVSGSVSNNEDLDQLLTDLFKNQPDTKHSISGFLDKAATYMALAVMFPHDIRPKFIEAHASGRMTESAIAEELGISPEHVPELLGPRWDTLRNLFLHL